MHRQNLHPVSLPPKISLPLLANPIPASPFRPECTRPPYSSDRPQSLPAALFSQEQCRPASLRVSINKLVPTGSESLLRSVSSSVSLHTVSPRHPTCLATPTSRRSASLFPPTPEPPLPALAPPAWTSPN